jgi:hypothetical protein
VHHVHGAIVRVIRLAAMGGGSGRCGRAYVIFAPLKSATNPERENTTSTTVKMC